MLDILKFIINFDVLELEVLDYTFEKGGEGEGLGEGKANKLGLSFSQF